VTTLTLRRGRQTVGFFRKESIDIGRQPRLILMLVLGPFLVLLAFGLGYKRSPDPYRTLFVVPAGSPFAGQVDTYAADLGRYVRLAGTTDDANAAEASLRKGHVDIVVVFPADPLGTIVSGRQAPITIMHTQLDPVEQTAIDFASRLAVDEINSQILASIVRRGQQAAQPLGDVFTAATNAIHAADQALSGADANLAQQRVSDLNNELGQLRATLEGTIGVSQQLVNNLPSSFTGAAQTATDALSRLDQETAAAQASIANGNIASAQQQLARIDADMTGLRANFDALTTVQAEILVKPFTSQVEALGDPGGTITDFYAPAAIVLLVQQFGVAFGAVTFVRERALGTIETYQAAPVSAGPLLLGKYSSYLLIGGAMSAVLVVLAVRALDVPLVGDPGAIAIALALVLLASVGLGFIISLLSRSDTQAVQYSSLVLLASLFFSGFFLAVSRLTYPAHLISWLLPSTYGIRLLRDVMLRGAGLDAATLAGLGVYAVIAVLLSYVGARRLLASR
jgi:ABC-2 type transport system permease protein